MKTRRNPADGADPVSGPLDDKFYPKRLLDGLNGKRDFGKEQRASAGTRASDAEYHGAKEAFVTELRKLIDAWLDSGRVAGGVFEVPRDRKVKVTIPNLGASENRMRERTVFDSIQCWLMDRPPLIFLAGNGEVKVSLGHPLKWWLEKPGQVDEPIAAALDEARNLFLLLMASRTKYAIFKCSHPRCGVYFILEKPRGEYKLGAVCPEHRRQQGTRRQRKKDHEEALQIARGALAAWPNLSVSTRAKHKSEKDYIASKLKRFGVGSKWVTRNLAEISKRNAGEK